MGNQSGKDVAGKPALAKFVGPNGVYSKCDWEEKVVAKYIYSQKLAPRYPPCSEESPELEECPICYMYYPGGLNLSKCCKQGLCTECYLQVKKPTEPKSPCPFCQQPSFSVTYKGAKDASDLAREYEERKRVESTAAEARAREESSPEAQRMRQRASDILRTPVDIPSPPPSRPLPPVAAASAQRRRPRPQRNEPAELFAIETTVGQGWSDVLRRLAADPMLRRSAAEIEELMLMEAVRQSLAEQERASARTAAAAAAPVAAPAPAPAPAVVAAPPPLPPRPGPRLSSDLPRAAQLSLEPAQPAPSVVFAAHNAAPVPAVPLATAAAPAPAAAGDASAYAAGGAARFAQPAEQCENWGIVMDAAVSAPAAVAMASPKLEEEARAELPPGAQAVAQ